MLMLQPRSQAGRLPSLVSGLALLLAACDPGSPNTGATDRTDLQAKIQFPTLNALTESATVRVSGTASDIGSGVATVTVNDLPAKTTDGFAHWSVEVPLMTVGQNILEVSVRDQAGNTNASAARAQVKRVPFLFGSPAEVALDSANNRALLTDDELKAVVAVDLSNGKRSMLSDNTMLNSGPLFITPKGIAIDIDNNRALVVDPGIPALLAVHLSTGERTVLSDNTNLDSSDPAYFKNPYGVAVASLKNQDDLALVTDRGSDSILIVNLVSNTNERIVLEDTVTGEGDAEIRFRSLEGITFDSTTGDNGRALVVDSDLRALLAVDLDSGDRSVVSDKDQPDGINRLTFPSGVTLSSDTESALVTDWGLDTLFAVNLATGARRVVSNNTTPNGNNAFNNPQGVALDSINNRALVVGPGLGAVLAVNLSTDSDAGARMVLAGDFTPNSENSFTYPEGMALDSANNQVLVVDSDLVALLAVDLTTGARRVLSDNTPPNSETAFDEPRFVALDRANNQALVVDSLLGLLAVNLRTGARSVLSDRNIPNSDNPFGYPEAITVDATGERALILDSGRPALFSVDITSGARTVLSDNTENSAHPFSGPTGIALDKANERVLVTDRGLKALLEVNLDTGERSVISDNTMQTSDSAVRFQNPRKVALDSNKNRAVVLDIDLNTLFAVDLNTGVRTVLSDNTTPNNDNAFIYPRDLIIDNANNRALVSDTGRKAVIAVDLDTGERVIFSK